MRPSNRSSFFRYVLLVGSVLMAQRHVVQAAQAAEPPPHAPKELQPPGEQALILRATGKGVQIYTCQNTGGSYAWKLKAPDAKLYGENGETIGRHYAGPTWESKDGSRITGKVAASVASSDPRSIPWLLLTVASHEGAGVLSQVQSVQRLNTKGGKAAASGCSAANENGETSVPYEAEYYFYRIVGRE